MRKVKYGTEACAWHCLFTELSVASFTKLLIYFTQHSLVRTVTRCSKRSRAVAQSIKLGGDASCCAQWLV